MIPMRLTFLLLVANQGIVPPISVAVVAPKGVPDSLVRRISAEVQPIWKPTGLHSNGTASHRTTKPVACHLKSRSMIDDRPWTLTTRWAGSHLRTTIPIASSTCRVPPPRVCFARRLAYPTPRSSRTRNCSDVGWVAPWRTNVAITFFDQRVIRHEA